MSYTIPAQHWAQANNILQNLIPDRQYTFGTGEAYPAAFAVFHRPGLHQVPGYEIWTTRAGALDLHVYDILVSAPTDTARIVPAYIIVADAFEAQALVQRVTGGAYEREIRDGLRRPGRYEAPFVVLPLDPAGLVIWTTAHGALAYQLTTIVNAGDPRGALRSSSTLANDPRFWPLRTPAHATDTPPRQQTSHERECDAYV